MKKSVYDKLEDIPQIDRDENNYQLCSDAGSPNNGKWVLLLDGAHPVQMKNTELLSEKAGMIKKAEYDTAIKQKDTEITRLSGELTAAKSQSGLPAGQVAVPAEDAALVTQVKQLGKFEDIKAKVDEHTVLKQKDEANTRKTLLTEAATAHGFNPDAFVSLAELKNLAPVLEMREVPNPKKPEEKVKHYFVKGKDSAGADTSTLLTDFVKNSDDFKPFLPSLTTVTDKSKVRIPNNDVGTPPKDTSAAKSYINSRYKRPDQKPAE